MKLVKSLEGKGTGWCTAGIETARWQLQGGDFHVYYTKDKTKINYAKIIKKYLTNDFLYGKMNYNLKGNNTINNNKRRK